MQRRFGLGLRTQILLSLGVVFAVSFPLFGLASVQLTRGARTADRVRDAETTARVVAASIDGAGAQEPRALGAMLAALLADPTIEGVEIARAGEGSVRRGRIGEGRLVEQPIDPRRAETGVLRLWIRSTVPADGPPVANLLLLYVAVTAAAVLLFAFVALTVLIVRPVEAVTLASERLAAGAGKVSVPVRGAAEVVRLAVAFNAMAAQLRDERVALENRLRELERTTKELESAHETVVRSARLASVGRLSAGVAHEIGNPLSAILGLLELLRSGDLDATERDEFLARIQAETERIHFIIRDLLDFARHETDDAAGSGDADLGEVVDDALGLIAPQKSKRRLRIVKDYAEAVPKVRGASERLTQVVLNLLLNAVDAIEGEGTIRVTLAPADGGSRVVLAVEDTGRGIDPDVSERLFEPFVTTKPAGKGTGLGLAVCHTIVARLGGTIRASNRPDGGARFEITLPAA